MKHTWNDLLLVSFFIFLSWPLENKSIYRGSHDTQWLKTCSTGQTAAISPALFPEFSQNSFAESQITSLLKYCFSYFQNCAENIIVTCNAKCQITSPWSRIQKSVQQFIPKTKHDRSFQPCFSRRLEVFSEVQFGLVDRVGEELLTIGCMVNEFLDAE